MGPFCGTGGVCYSKHPMSFRKASSSFTSAQASLNDPGVPRLLMLVYFVNAIVIHWIYNELSQCETLEKMSYCDSFGLHLPTFTWEVKSLIPILPRITIRFPWQYKCLHNLQNILVPGLSILLQSAT